MAGRVIISFQGSKNTCSQLRDSGRRCGSFCASFCLGKEILTGERQTCFILHYPLPPHTVHFLPYPCAQMWHKAFSLQQSPYSISAVFPQSSTQHCSSHFDLCIPLFFFFSLHLTAQCLSDTGRHCWVSLAPMLTHSAPRVALWLVWSSMQEHTLKTWIPALTNTRFIKLNHRP